MMHDGYLKVPDDDGPLTRATGEATTKNLLVGGKSAKSYPHKDIRWARTPAECRGLSRIQATCPQTRFRNRAGWDESTDPPYLYRKRRSQRTESAEKSLTPAAARHPFCVKCAFAGGNMVWRPRFKGPQCFVG